VVDTDHVEPRPQVGPVDANIVGSEQIGDVVGLGLVRSHVGPQDRAGPLRSFAGLISLDRERADTGGHHRCRSGHRRLPVEQQHLLEGHIAHLAGVTEDGPRRCQSHLAVSRTRQDRDFVYLVVGQPGLRLGADLALPQVTLRLLRHRDVRTQQRMHGYRAGPTRRDVVTVTAQ